jgi:hypothetical protein
MADVVNPSVAETPILNTDIHAVLTVCCFTDVSSHTHIINNVGFQSLMDFGLLDSDKDVFEMVKHLAGHTEGAGHVHIGTIQVKKLQALCYWVCDHQKHGQPIDHNNWDKAAQATIEMMHIKQGWDTGNVSVSDLGKVGPDDFETYEMAFINLLAQTYGVNKESLKYIVHASVVPDDFADEDE